MSTPIPTGARVRVTQQAPFGTKTLATTIEGVVLNAEQSKTGSWYAHSKDHKLWLDRLTLKKDDGEIIVINLDRYSRVEVFATA